MSFKRIEEALGRLRIARVELTCVRDEPAFSVGGLEHTLAYVRAIQRLADAVDQELLTENLDYAGIAGSLKDAEAAESAMALLGAVLIPKLLINGRIKGDKRPMRALVAAAWPNADIRLLKRALVEGRPGGVVGWTAEKGEA